MTWLEDATLLATAAWTLATYALVWMTVAPGLAFLPIVVGVACHLWWREAAGPASQPATQAVHRWPSPRPQE